MPTFNLLQQNGYEMADAVAAKKAKQARDQQGPNRRPKLPATPSDNPVTIVIDKTCTEANGAGTSNGNGEESKALIVRSSGKGI